MVFNVVVGLVMPFSRQALSGSPRKPSALVEWI
jgi:hypothetical protein